MDYEKKYEQALQRAKKLQKTCDSQSVVGWCEYLFPELKKSDERIRKYLLKLADRCPEDSIDFMGEVKKEDVIAWLEKHGTSSQVSIWKHWKNGIAGNGEGESIYLVKYGNTYSLNSCLSFECDYIELSELDNLMLEKQGEQKSLYIRFGDVPNNEKSKIYRGEKEIGEENGVSVYPAFEVNGNIVLGLTLPITKTTLHTQQHLLEYDDRPCYLVKGNYVGKDTDGQPLIDNVHIIRKIDSYRVKEEKVDDANKVEQKFHEGDWVVLTAGELSSTLQIVNVDTNKKLYWFNDSSYLPIVDEECLRLWTIQDAKDGDVLYSPCLKLLWIFKSRDTVYCGCNLTNNNGAFCGEGYIEMPTDAIPATKEQRDTLMKAMAEAGYAFDFEKKELKKIEPQPAWSDEDEKRIKNILSVLDVQVCWDGATLKKMNPYQKEINWLKSLKDRVQPQPKQEWSEIDKNFMYDILSNLTELKDRYGEGYGNVRKCIEWLNSIKQRIGG